MADLFSDGFESGDLTAWSTNANDSGDLSAHADAKLHGNYGLKCFIDDTNSLFVKDYTPSTETRYRCRFYFDPNELSMNADTHLDLFSPTEEDAPWFPSFLIRLHYISSQYQIEVADRTDNAWNKATSKYTITDAPHCIEVDWTAATGEGQNDGTFTLWIDGVLKETVIEIDSDTENIGYAVLGTVEINSGISGTCYLDDFASNNDGSEIGLISAFPENYKPPCKYDTANQGYDESVYDIGTLREAITMGVAEVITSKTGSLAKAEVMGGVDTKVTAVVFNLNEAMSGGEALGNTGELAQAEAVGLASAIVKTAQHALAEAIGLADAITSSVIKNLFEAIAMVDSTVKSASHALAEAIGMVDTWLWRLLLSEAIGVVDTIVTSAVKALSEKIGLADVFRKSINWVQEIIEALEWTEELKNTITWTEEEKSDDDMWTEETKI